MNRDPQVQSYALTKNSPKIKQPKGFKYKFTNPQLISIYAGGEFEKNGGFTRLIGTESFKIKSNIAILANIVGSGKTAVILGIINQYVSNIDKCKISYTITACDNLVSAKGIRSITCSDKTLIVVPNALVTQWEKELTKTPLKWYTIPRSGTVEIKDITEPVILCRSTRYNHFMGSHNNGATCFYRVVIDEPDTINIKTMCEPNYYKLWLLTATPEAMEYTLRSVYIKKMFKNNIFKYLGGNNMVKTTDILSIHVSPEYIRECANIPPITKHFVKCFSPAHLNIIRSLIPSHVTTMLHAGDLVGALGALGHKPYSKVNIIDIIYNRIENKKQYYQNLIQEARNNITIEKKEKDTRIENHTKHIKDLEQIMSDFKNKLDNIHEQDCSICYGSIKNLCLTPCCNAFFCQECISKWIIKCSTCPSCRSRCNVTQLIIYVSKSQHVTANQPQKEKELSKEHSIKKILLDHPKESFLIFSEIDNTWNVLQNINLELNMEKNKNIYEHSFICMLGGNAGHIRILLEKSENKKIQALFMNAKRHGSGLNMPWIDNIIIYHKLNEDTLTQVIGRTYRLGQTKSVNVWFLQHDNEYSQQPNTHIFE